MVKEVRNVDDLKLSKLVDNLIDYVDELTKQNSTEEDSFHVAENTKALAMLLIAKAFMDNKI